MDGRPLSPDAYADIASWILVAREKAFAPAELPAWHSREAARPLHPAVIRAFHHVAQVTPLPPGGIMYFQPEVLALEALLAREWPHVSTDGRLAYTRTPEHGEADRQTVTSAGKYLARVMDLPPHVIDNIVRRIDEVSDPRKLVILTTADGMVEEYRTNGFGSCMGGDKFAPINHPIRAYDPALGWGLAVLRTDPANPGTTTARGIINDATYVRLYGPDAKALEDLLQAKGYEICEGWGGLKLKTIEYRDGWRVPYFDGDCSSFSDNADGTLTIEDSGPHERSQDGYIPCKEEGRGEVQLENGDWVGEDYAVLIDGEYYLASDCQACEGCGAVILRVDLRDTIVNADDEEEDRCEDCRTRITVAKSAWCWQYVSATAQAIVCLDPLEAAPIPEWEALELGRRLLSDVHYIAPWVDRVKLADVTTGETSHA